MGPRQPRLAGKQVVQTLKRAGWYVAHQRGLHLITVPALPGCITQGETVEQCIERAREIIAGFIEDLIANGESVPKEIERPQMVTIDVVT